MTGLGSPAPAGWGTRDPGRGEVAREEGKGLEEENELGPSDHLGVLSGDA